MRAVHLSRHARNAYKALGPAEREALECVIFGFMDENLPLVRAEDGPRRHGVSMMGRPVPGTDLIVCYIPAGPSVHVVNVTRR